MLRFWICSTIFPLILVKGVLFFNSLYRYETLVGTIGKKFLRKRDQRVLKDDDEDKEDEVEEGNNTRPSKRAKKMFLKPQD